MSTALKLTKKDMASSQEVRWCPGCGDYAILSAAQAVFADLGVPREKFVIVSGIGCSSRFPYYMNTYGFHTIHGRAPAIATGVKINNPDLSVWIVTGDGDALSIGGNHLVHVLRRNVGVKIMLFDNRIYGLTKGQYSPTSEIGKRTKSTPYGSLDRPFRVIALAVGAQATFVARSIDTYTPHLKKTLKAAHEHSGTAFIQIFQNCNIFNDGAFDFREKNVREDNLLQLEHGQPLVFGKKRDRGIRMKSCYEPEIVQLGNGLTEDDLLIHDETAPPGYAAMLADMRRPIFPLPVGIIRRVAAPVFEVDVHRQVEEVKHQRGADDLQAALNGGNTWEVR